MARTYRGAAALLLLDAGNLTIHPRCVRLKDAFGR